jgi:hypothetical protein
MRGLMEKLRAKRYLVNPTVNMDGFIIGYENIEFNPPKVGRDE